MMVSPTSRPGQSGFTLVELMVALVLGLLVTAAAVGALIVARQGFNSVDSAGQLGENARFTADVLQRIGVQAGFVDVAAGDDQRWLGSATVPKKPREPGILGFDNSVVGNLATLPASLANDTRTAAACGASDTSCLNGSDVLVVRFWGTSGPAGVADGSMIDCAGIAEPDGNSMAPLDQRAYSIFHVIRGTSGEPSLACTYRTPGTATWVTAPLVQGVEAFQVLYGVDNAAVAANVAPPTDNTNLDSVTDRYLTARQMTVPGDAVGTANNWRRVRSLRIGLLFRGAGSSAVDRAASGMLTWEPLGVGVSSSADIGSALTVAADGRLRQRSVMSVHLRNQQGFDPP